MPLIKADRKTKEVTETIREAVYREVDGEQILDGYNEYERVRIDSYPDGFEEKGYVSSGGSGENTLWFVSEEDAKGKTPATLSDLPERTDLPESHPLYGQKVLSCVPAGSPDLTLDKDGNLEPVFIPEPEKPEEITIEEVEKEETPAKSQDERL